MSYLEMLDWYHKLIKKNGYNLLSKKDKAIISSLISKELVTLK